jgi:hypothetical protein
MNCCCQNIFRKRNVIHLFFSQHNFLLRLIIFILKFFFTISLIDGSKLHQLTSNRMEEEKNMTHVWLVNNPLKQIIWEEKYIYNRNSKSEKIKFFVPIVQEYMDLSKGVWNVSLDTYVIKNLDYAVDTVLDISTNLVSGIRINKSANTHESQNVCMGKIYLFAAPNTVTAGPFEKKWFTVQCGKEHSNFELYVKQNFLADKLNSLILDFEISFLFQRIK